jgi:two-component system response regulator
MSGNEPVEILLVEDSPDDTELTLRALRKAGLGDRVMAARDGVEALDFLFCQGVYSNRHIEDIPKVIVLDLKLPKIDGMEVLRRIKGDPRTKKIPVVVLTSSMDLKDVTGCYELGVNSYIVKPLNFERFSAAVQQVGTYWLRVNQPPKIER